MLKLHLTMALLILFSAAAHATDFPSTSGMADLGGDKMLLVDDTKDKPETTHNPRLRVATLVPGKTTIEPVNEDWGKGDPPNDLECIAPVPNQPGHFLIGESGYVGQKYGRIFLVEVKQDGGKWHSSLFGIGSMQEPPGLLRDDLEGLAVAAKLDGSLVLLLSERGGRGAYSPGWLWWGDLDLAAGTFTQTDDNKFGQMSAWPEKACFPWARSVSDLYLDPAGYLWASGAEDMGDDGPFRSVIYRLGRFDANQVYPVQYDGNMDLFWRIDGLKIEAIGPPTTPGSILNYATDDENFGGVWRPLPPAEMQPPQPYYGPAGD